MDIKELKRIAAACRKAGISHFKSADYEFTLTEDVPLTAYKQAKAALHSTQKTSSQGDDIESDGLTEQDLLFWSVGKTDDLVAPAEDK